MPCWFRGWFLATMLAFSRTALRQHLNVFTGSLLHRMKRITSHQRINGARQRKGPDQHPKRSSARSHRNRAKSSSLSLAAAFTLIELLIVIAVIAILAS